MRGPVRGVESNRSSSPRTTTQHTTPKRYDMILDHNIEPWSPPAADSNISDPIISFLPPAYYLIIDRTGYMDMQQLTSMGGYSQSYGLASLVVELASRTSLPHDEAKTNMMLLHPYLIDFTIEDCCH